jgi:hypothetical protein
VYDDVEVVAEERWFVDEPDPEALDGFDDDLAGVLDGFDDDLTGALMERLPSGTFESSGFFLDEECPVPWAAITLFTMSLFDDVDADARRELWLEALAWRTFVM